MPIKKRYLTLLFAFLFAINPSLIEAKEVYLGGENIGIEINNTGLTITGTYDVKDNKSIYNPSVNSDIKKGDILIKVENRNINTLNELLDYLKSVATKDSVEVTILRDNREIIKSLRLVKDDTGNIKTGLYIKDSLLGVGTITYYDPNNNVYGALGHEMSDSLNNRSDLLKGSIYDSKVTLIKKSENGNPGEKMAIIDKNAIIGDIKINSIYGIYGKYVNVVKDELIETANIEEIEKGKAYIYTVIDGNKVEKFEIEITDLKKQDSKNVKGITFKITDKKLLNVSNGVVAGMSGSPIVQNGKLVGAVTHVVVDNVRYGYGIYLEWMLDEEELVN